MKTLTSSQTIAAGAGSNVVQKTSIASPHLWNGRKDPYLYRVYVEIRDGSVVTDLVAQPFGFRFFSVDASAGFSLNGQYLDLHGVNRHQDRLDKGWAICDAEHDEDFAMIAEIGATAVRLAHYQHAQHFYDLCRSATASSCGRRSRWSTSITDSDGVLRQRQAAADRADPPELQPPFDPVLGHRQRAAHRR